MNVRFPIVSVLAAAGLLLLSSTPSIGGSVLLWNKLGSNAEIENSEIGPDGVVIGGSYAFEAGKFGNGYIRKATGSNYVRFPVAVLNQVRERGTATIWVNPKVQWPVAYQYGLFGLINGAYVANGSIALMWGDTVSGGSDLNGSLDFGTNASALSYGLPRFAATPGTPFHAALVWDINGIEGTDDTVRVYRDGALITRTNAHWTPTGTLRPDLIVGASPDSGGYDKYVVDNLVLYDYAKTNFSDRFNESPSNSNPPKLALPSLGPTEATGPSGAVVEYSVTATDDDDPNPDVVCSPESGSTFALGETTVSCTATDTSGNVDSGSFAVSVVDTTAPDLTLPADLAVEGNASGGGNVTLAEASATDSVDTQVTAECAPSSGYFMLGDHAIRCSASDASGNTSQGSYTLTVQDTTAPTLNLPATFISEGNTAGGANLTLPTVTAADVVDGSPGVSCDRTSGFFALDETSVSCSAEDDSGNATNGSYFVQVVDTVPPEVGIQRVTTPMHGWLPKETITEFPAMLGATPVVIDAMTSDVVGIKTVSIDGLQAQGGPESWTLADFDLLEGDNYPSARAIDLGGNERSETIYLVLNFDVDEDAISNDVDRQPYLPSDGFSDQSHKGLGKGPNDVVVSPDGNTAYVANRRSGSVSVLDTSTWESIATIDVEGNPWAIALSPDGSRAYVTTGASFLSVIDTASKEVIARPEFGGEPLQLVAVRSDGREVYVSTRYPVGAAPRVHALDTQTNQRTWSVEVPGPPLALAVRGTLLYVTTTDGALRVIDANARRIVSGVFLGSGGYALAIHPTSADVYATYGVHLSVFSGGLGLRQRIYVGCTAEDLAFTSTADRLWATCPPSRRIQVINPTTGGLEQSILVGTNPRGLAFHPDGQVAYVANEGGTESGSLSVIDVPGVSVTDTLFAGPTSGTSFGRIADYGDQYGALKIKDRDPPYGLQVSVDSSGGASPAVINPCGTDIRYSYRPASTGLIRCRSADLQVEAGLVEVSFETPDGMQGYAEVGAGNGLILDPPVFPFDPPFTMQAPETNQSPVVVEIDGEPLVLEPGATPPTFSDGDSIPDDLDNCPTLDNQDQMDANHDSFGDACVPLSVGIAKNVSIAQPILIGNGTSISKDSRIGSGAVIGDDASIDKSFRAGDNLRIGDRARVDKEAILGNNVSLGAEVNIDQGARISDSVMIGDRTRMAKGVQIGEASVIGADCNIGQQVRIGKRVIIGDGAVVPSRAVVPDGTLMP